MARRLQREMVFAPTEIVSERLQKERKRGKETNGWKIKGGEQERKRVKREKLRRKSRLKLFNDLVMRLVFYIYIV